MTEEYDRYQEIGKGLVDAIESKLFGKPCFKINNKAFICFFENEMVFKLSGDAHGKALSLEGAKLFDPSGKGRPMKEWVQIPYQHNQHWLKFAEESMAYVRQL